MKQSAIRLIPAHAPKGLILDLDGTLYRAEHAIAGAPEAIAQLRQWSCPVAFVTNAIESPAEHVARLARFNIGARPDEVINAATVLMQQLHRQLPNATVYAIADPPLLLQLAKGSGLAQIPMRSMW